MAPVGVDISHWQSGEYPTADFYIVRLGYGTQLDDMAAQHVAYAKAHNLPVGGYWACLDNGAATAQACYAEMQKLGIFRIAVDAEQFSGAPTLTPQVVKDFVAEMQKLNGDCGIYSGIWAKDNGGSTFGADWGWLADYTAEDLPSGWTKDFTVLWQYTSNNGTLDQDRWESTADLAHWFEGSDMAGYDDFHSGWELAKGGKPLPSGASLDETFGFNLWNDIQKSTQGPKGDPGPAGPPGGPGPAGPAGPGLKAGDVLTVGIAGAHLKLKVISVA